MMKELSKDQLRKRRHYVANKERYLERARLHKLRKKAERGPIVYEYLTNAEKAYKRSQVNPIGHLLSRAKSRAKQKGLEFDLHPEDIVIPSLCPYLGLPLEFNKGAPKKNSISLDRIDNLKGYIKGNVEVISYLANTMKRDTTIEERLKFAQEVLKRHAISKS